MDAKLQGYHPALRQAWDTPTQAEETPGPPAIDQAPTFSFFARHLRLHLIYTGLGGPDSVADGSAVGATGNLTNEALAGLGAELWPPADLANRHVYLNFAYLERTASDLGLNHSPLPRNAAARLEGLIAAGLTDPQFMPNAVPPVTSLVNDLAMETTVTEASILAEEVATARTAFKAAPSDAAATVLSDLEAQLAKIMLASGNKTPPARAGSTVEPRTSPPPKAAPQTPKSLADGAAIRLLQQKGAGRLFINQEQYPATTKLVSSFGTPASVDTMGPAMLDHVIAFMATQEAVKAAVVRGFTLATSADFGMPAAAISGAAADTTFAALVTDGLAHLALQPFAIFWGLVPCGDLAMVHAKTFHVPRANPAANDLLEVTARMNFRGPNGSLSLQAPSRLLVDAQGRMFEDIDADWNMAFRNVAAAVARASGLEFKTVGEDGVSRDWSQFALQLVTRVANEGLSPTGFTRSDFAALTSDVSRFSRLLARREQQLQAVQRYDGGVGGGPASVLAAQRDAAPSWSADGAAQNGDAWPWDDCEEIIGGGGSGTPQSLAPDHHAPGAHGANTHGALWLPETVLNSN